MIRVTVAELLEALKRADPEADAIETIKRSKKLKLFHYLICETSYPTLKIADIRLTEDETKRLKDAYGDYLETTSMVRPRAVLALLRAWNGRSPESESNRDVHTEHCCSIHGCQYGQRKKCPVESGKKAQSGPCESCDDFM